MASKFNYKMVIFDVDGTILDTSEGLLASVKYTIQKHQKSELSEEEVLSFIGPPVQDSFKKYYSLSDEETQVMADTFRNRYKDVDLLKAIPYENIYKLFECLKNNGIVTAIATYKREDYAKRLMDYFKFNKYTDIIYGADNFNRLKKKDIIRKCMERVPEINADEILVIGDSISDGVGAKENGCAFCGVTYGFGTKSVDDFKNIPAEFIISDVAELIDLVEK